MGAELDGPSTEGAIGDRRIGVCEYMCIATTETPKPRWKAIGLWSHGSRSYEPGTLPAGLAPKVHRRIGDRELESAVILDSEKSETPKPDRESGITTAKCRGREESQKDLWIGFAQ
jgi:hypothetical protein